MWTEEMTNIIKEKFVAVAVSGHVAMNRKDEDGEFLRKTGIRLAGAGGNLECLTANGIRLGSFYAAGGSEFNMREVKETLRKFNELAENERKPSAVKVPEQSSVAENVKNIEPPKNALVLRTYHRILTQEKDGKVRKAAVTDYPKEAGLGDKDTWRTFFGEKWEAQPDFMWIKEEEWKAIVKTDSKKGDSYPLLPAVADRMTRAHLISGMAYGECGICAKTEVRSSSLTLYVTEASEEVVQLRLEGAAALGSDQATSEKEDRKGKETGGRSVQGFEPKVLGYLTWDRKSGAFARFDVIALGDSFGTPGGAYFFYYRPGRYPIGISMEMVSGKIPAERVPPRGAVIYDTTNPAYFTTGK